ncbi:MAG: hypothetical protein ACYDAG_08710 [Chloroflexota bacterium]
MLPAKQHAAALRQRQARTAPLVNQLSDEELLVRHYLHVATQGLYLRGEVAPHAEELHAEGFRRLTNRSWGLRKTDEAAVRKVVEAALRYNFGIDTY